MKHCHECGEKVNKGNNFCTSCGQKLEINPTTKPEPIKSINENLDFSSINKKLNLENNQTKIVSRSWYVAVFFGIIIVSAMMEFFPVHPAVFMLSLFFMICALVVALMFKSREKKLQTLISGENLLSQWTLTDKQKKKYVDYQFQQNFGMNILMLLVIGVIAVIIFGLFILMIDEGRLFMFFVLLGLIAFLALFAFGMPYYYKFTNNKGDGRILIGAKYAYINGYFHNWDFIMSGLRKIKIIKEPFYGLSLEYYYTDRTYQHSEILVIPANEDIDLKFLVTQLKTLNE